MRWPMKQRWKTKHWDEAEIEDEAGAEADFARFAGHGAKASLKDTLSPKLQASFTFLREFARVGIDPMARRIATSQTSWEQLNPRRQ